MLTHEQWQVHDRISTLLWDTVVDAEDRFVEELCRHVPGMAPAMRVVA